MKITRISTDQFAGIKDKSIALDSGINIIYGKNETGKSTLVNLISRTLFQKAKLDKRTDKDFIEKYFPTKVRGSDLYADFIEGKIELEYENNKYILAKEWGENSNILFDSPVGKIKNEDKITEELSKILQYGEGVYADILLSNQKNSDISLEKLLNGAEKTDAKQAIISSVTKAFAETGGISVNAIENAINAKISDMQGMHWDIANNKPMRKSGGGQWKNGLGAVLIAYYDLENKQNILTELESLENDVDKYAKAYTISVNKTKDAQREFDDFQMVAVKITTQRVNEEKLSRINSELQRLCKISLDMPNLKLNFQNAKRLKEEKENREILDIYIKAKSGYEQIEKLKAKIKDYIVPDEKDISQAKKAIREIEQQQNKLCGMNLNAVIKMLNNSNIQITSVRTGEELNLNDNSIAISEAVNITIPDVIEMQLAPLNVNVAEIKQTIEDKNKEIAGIFNKYNVKSIQELEQKLDEYKSIQNELVIAENTFNFILKGRNYNELKSQIEIITGFPRDMEEILLDIKSICGKADIADFIAEKNAVILSNEKEYGNETEIKAKIDKLKIEQEKIIQEIRENNVPEKYSSVLDAEAYLNKLKSNLEECMKTKEKIAADKIAAETKLDSKSEKNIADMRDEVEFAESEFNRKADLLRSWIHIKEVFEKEKEKIDKNPKVDIADKFIENLADISNHRISSDFECADKFDISIYSNNRIIDFQKLSEGSKETISLAFRLAVLDHLFPKGGGILVLDDPLSDMDNERANKACQLIKKSADRHQILFLTCHNEYNQLLNGNLIEL